MFGMSQVCAGSDMNTSQPFLALAQGDPTVLTKLVDGFQMVISGSFAIGQDPVRTGSPTANHVRERFKICERDFRQLRAEKKWGVQRILDKLPEYLHCELNGQSWEPDERSVWVPTDGR